MPRVSCICICGWQTGGSMPMDHTWIARSCRPPAMSGLLPRARLLWRPQLLTRVYLVPEDMSRALASRRRHDTAPCVTQRGLNANGTVEQADTAMRRGAATARHRTGASTPEPISPERCGHVQPLSAPSEVVSLPFVCLEGGTPMGLYLSARELAQLDSAEQAFPSPVPTQIISNGEFNPLPQTAQQQQVETRIQELADTHGAKQGLDRRQFLRTSG